jgi:hypothetical protein
MNNAGDSRLGNAKKQEGGTMSIVAIVAIAVVVLIVFATITALASTMSGRREFRRLRLEAQKAD